MIQTRTTQLGQFIKEKRGQRGYTQKALAKHLGFDNPQFISSIERGAAVVPESWLSKLAVLFNMTYESVADMAAQDYREVLLERMNREVAQYKC